MPFKLVDSINNAANTITDGYGAYAILRNPIFTSFIITFIAVSLYLVKGCSTTSFVIALFINTAYLFLYQNAIKRYYTTSSNDRISAQTVAEIVNSPSS